MSIYIDQFDQHSSEELEEWVLGLLAVDDVSGSLDSRIGSGDAISVLPLRFGCVWFDSLVCSNWCIALRVLTKWFQGSPTNPYRECNPTLRRPFSAVSMGQSPQYWTIWPWSTVWRLNTSRYSRIFSVRVRKSTRITAHHHGAVESVVLGWHPPRHEQREIKSLGQLGEAWRRGVCQLDTGSDGREIDPLASDIHTDRKERRETYLRYVSLVDILLPLVRWLEIGFKRINDCLYERFF